jgi:transposase
MSLIAGVSQDRVEAYQVLEGGTDSTLFMNFIHCMLVKVMVRAREEGKEVCVFMDNAVIHKHSMVINCFRRAGVHVLFNAEYSPWLNPVEQYFGHIKREA